MASPVPKHPSERRNRAKPARGEWIEIDKPRLDEPVLPELTSLQKAHFNLVAKEHWRVWRYEPVTTYWSSGDVRAAMDLLELYNCRDWTRNAMEIRHRETQLALNPKGKRDLRFRITFGHGAEATKDSKPPEVEDENVVNLDARRQSLLHSA